MCNSDTHDRNRREVSTRKNVQEIEYEDHTGRNISDDPDGNNFVIDAIDLPANNEINVTAVYNKHSSFELKIDSWCKVQRLLYQDNQNVENNWKDQNHVV